MGALWLPSDDELVVAQREPNLLVPGKQAVNDVVLDWNNPLAHGLESGLFMLGGDLLSNTENSGTPMRTSIVNPQNINNAVANTIGKHGRAFHVAGLDQYIGWASGTSNDDFSQTQTFTTCMLIDVLDLANNDADAYFWNVGLRSDIYINSSGNFEYRYYDGSFRSLSSAIQARGQDQVFLAAVRQQGVGTKFWVNGELVASNSLTANISYVTTSGRSTRIGQTYSVSALLAYFDLYLIAHYPNRALSDREIVALSKNPYQILKPANSTPYLFPVMGGGGAYSLTADTGGFAATGTAAGLIASRKLAADSQSYALGGQSANLVRSFALLAESGDFTVSGGAASLLADRALTAALGAYSLSGIDAGLTYTPVGNYSITADAGAFALTGAGAAILADRALAADAQSYALTGIDAALTYTPSGAYSLAADSGSFALTGAAVTLTYTPAGSYSMPADSVAFGVTGHDAGLLADRVNTAEAGSFALTGVDAALAYGYSMPAESAPFALTGVDAGFGRTYQLTAELGEFTLTGVAATLRYSAAVTMSGRVQLERGTLRSIRSSRTLRT